MRDTSDLSTKKLIIKKYEVLPFLGMQFYIISHQFGIIFDLSSSKKDKTTLSTKVGNQMQAVNLSLPSTEFSESIRKYQNSFWRWYEKLSSICESTSFRIGWLKTVKNLINCPIINRFPGIHSALYLVVERPSD